MSRESIESKAKRLRGSFNVTTGCGEDAIEATVVGDNGHDESEPS